MKRIQKLSWLYLAAAMLVISTSCSKDDDSNGTGSVYKQPSISENTPEVKAPEGLQSSTDPYAQMAAGYITLANSLTSSFSSFAIPDGATETTTKSGDESHVWSWTNGTTSYWMTYWEDASKYYWKYEMAATGISRFTVLTANEKKDGTGGEVVFYQTAGVVALTYTWTYSNGIYTINMETATATLDIVINADGSGTLDYAGGNSTCHIAWNADGSGSGYVSDGTDTYSFSWTAKK
jgi:hypothetical protein